MAVLRTTGWIRAQLALVVGVALLGVLAALTVQPARPVGDDVLRLVASAGSTGAAQGSYRMELEFGVDGNGVDLTVRGTAVVDAATGDGTGTLQLPGSGSGEIAFMSVGARGYLELPESSPSRLGGKEWVGFPLPAQQALTQDPLLFLQLLAGDGEVVELDGDEVRGVDTRHYRSELSREGIRSLAELQGDTLLTAEAIALVDGGTADVWLDDDGLPRRLQVQLEAQGLDIEVSFELFEYGVPVRVTAPAPSDVVEVPTQQEAVQFLSARP